MAEKEILAIRGLNASRGRSRILHDVNLEIDAGPPFAIVGESGSGKTTLLLCATGLLQPDSGEILIQGQGLETLDRKGRSRRIGLVFQDYQLFPHLTALENVLLAPRLQAETAVRENEARSLLAQLGIEKLESRYPHELSGGQRQRVAIARALILSPELLFLDEPTAALDEVTTRDLSRLLLELNRRSQIVVVSHDREFITHCCPRGARMADGKLIAQGALEALFSAHTEPAGLAE